MLVDEVRNALSKSQPARFAHRDMSLSAEETIVFPSKPSQWYTSASCDPKRVTIIVNPLCSRWIRLAPPNSPDRDIDNPPASRASRSRLFASWSNKFPAKFERPRERRPSSRRKSAQWRRYRQHGVPRHPARSRESARDRSWSTTPRQDTTPPCRAETKSFESSTELLDRAPPRWPRSRACRACRGSPMQNTLGMAEVLSFPVSICLFGKQNPFSTRKQTT